MNNYITVGGYLSTEGSITDITTNSIDTLLAAVNSSSVLNSENTWQASEKVVSSRESNQVVFEEIKSYLERVLGEGNYIITNQTFEW